MEQMEAILQTDRGLPLLCTSEFIVTCNFNIGMYFGQLRKVGRMVSLTVSWIAGDFCLVLERKTLPSASAGD